MIGRFLRVFFSVILISACQSKKAVVIDDIPPLPSKVEGTSDRVVVQMQSKLTQQNVRVISMGQNHLISIPAAMLFADQSPRIEWGAYGLLNDVACYLQQFRKISIQINGFSVPFGSAMREHALTLARARNVGDYLGSQGIDSRLIFTQGVGSDKPIIAHSILTDQSPNSRIEITFREAVA